MSYNIGSRVYRKNYTLSDASKDYSAKLAPKFVGPFIVSRKTSPWMYELTDLEGKWRGLWHVKDLRPGPLDTAATVPNMATSFSY